MAKDSGGKHRNTNLGLAWVVLALLLGLVGYKLYQASQTSAALEVAPDFELTTFDGAVIQLRDYLGQVVVINFWASWCIPCREEASVLEAAWQAFRDRGVMFIGVDYLDTRSDALLFIEEFGVTYANGPDTGTKIASAYRMRGVPETFFIDRQGRIDHIFIGAISKDELYKRIELLLNANE